MSLHRVELERLLNESLRKSVRHRTLSSTEDFLFLSDVIDSRIVGEHDALIRESGSSDSGLLKWLNNHSRRCLSTSLGLCLSINISYSK